MSNNSYKGATRRLVISFDVGTTFSGVSYCILDPGEVPKICSITRFPGQEHNASSSKIPSVLYYDKDATVRAVGAETELDHIIEQAEDEEWLKVQWFKLRFRPRSVSSSIPIKQITPLPESKSPTDVFADFLRYLMACAKSFITDAHPTVIQSWDELSSTASFILSHPNGWEGVQQARYRKACVQAELVPDTLEGKSRIIFVTEGEASLNYCLRGNHVNKLDTKNGFIVADMGGGTLDFSAYKTVGVQPLRVEEMTAARCELQGSTIVTERARRFIQEKLHKSARYNEKSIIDSIAGVFDRTTKRLYRGILDAVCYITFGSQLDRDLANDIKGGKLKLKGEQVAGFFDPSIKAALDAIEGQMREAPIPITAVYLVGGFSANQYLVAELKKHLREKGISVHCPDGQTIKAVADGSISFYVDHYVTTRVSKRTYLTLVAREFNPMLEDHKQRENRICISPSGLRRLAGSVDVMLQKGASVNEETEYRKDYLQEWTPDLIESCDTLFTNLYAYDGLEPIPRWEDEVSSDEYLKVVCKVSVPLQKLKYVESHRTNSMGKPYVEYNYSVILRFGGPEVMAQLCWKGKFGVEERSPAEIIYDNVDDDYESDEEDEVINVDVRTQDTIDKMQEGEPAKEKC